MSRRQNCVTSDDSGRKFPASGERAVARLASAPGGGAAGRGFEFGSTHDSHRGFPPFSSAGSAAIASRVDVPQWLG